MVEIDKILKARYLKKDMISKRGQVTIFIIIAIILIASMSLYFIFRDKITENTDIPAEIVPIKNFVDLCIEEKIEEAVYSIGLGGGYYFPPYLSDYSGYTYYFYEGENYFPSKEKIENQLSNVIESKISNCVGNFEEFPSYTIKRRAVEIKTDILDDLIIFDIEFPLRITLGKETNIVKDFGEHEFYVKLGIIHEEISNLIENDYYSEEKVCLDCFSSLIIEHNISVDYIDGGVGDSIFILGDFNKDYNKTFEFVFAV